MSNTRKIKKIHQLVTEFNELKNSGALDKSSEATARSWIESFLEIFGWNCLDPNEVDQEVSLGSEVDFNLAEIDSTHRRPDYLLCSKVKKLVFIDAKKISLNIRECRASAFQARSYGWSSGHSYVVLTNFNEIAIYDCRYKPKRGEAADVALSFYSECNGFVDNFDVIYRHFDKNFILSGEAFEQYENSSETKGVKTLDEDFSEHISKWRLRNFSGEFAESRKINSTHF